MVVRVHNIVFWYDGRIWRLGKAQKAGYGRG